MTIEISILTYFIMSGIQIPATTAPTPYIIPSIAYTEALALSISEIYTGIK
ncbi:hypothetical protein protein [Bacillus cereus G9241]|nr:hypothetical protein protein [Bacillus cereus G9241]